MHLRIATRALVLLTVLVGGAVLLAGRPVEVGALTQFLPPWDQWDNDDCGQNPDLCLIQAPGTATGDSSSSDSGPGHAHSVADAPPSGLAVATAWTEQGDEWSPPTSGRWGVAYDYAYDGSASGSASWTSGLVPSSFSNAHASVTAAVAVSGGADVSSLNEPVYDGNACDEAAGGTSCEGLPPTFDDVFQGTSTLTLDVNLNAADTYLLSGRLDVTASAIPPFMGVGSADADINSNGELLSVTVAPAPDIALESSPPVAAPDEFTPIELTFRNIGQTTIEYAGYYLEGLASPLDQGSPPLAPGETRTFNVNVDTRPYACTTMIKTAEVRAWWLNGALEYNKQFLVSVFVWVDDDFDGVCDPVDNCPSDPNGGQENTDSDPIPNGADITGSDSRANPDKDAEGDVCDTDDDNDGPDANDDLYTDAEEAIGCGSGPTDPLNKDTDGDGAIDGYECKMGTDPNNPADKPMCTNPADTDGDGFKDCLEEMAYGTSPLSTDTDGDSSGNDGCQDDKQIVDANDDGQANALDVAAIARIVFLPGPWDPVSLAVADMDKNGVNNVLDVALAALNSTLVESHSAC